MLLLFCFLLLENTYLLNGIYAVLYDVKRNRSRKDVYELNVFYVREFSIALIASRAVQSPDND